MVTERSRKRLPPYISYRTFRNFIDGLQQGIPSRIDRSYWGERFSGSTGIQLMAALRFLGLVDTNGIPNDGLRQLVMAKGDTRTEQLLNITNEAFAFLFMSNFDLQTATYSQLQELFHYTFQLTGDVSRKCIKFFIELASESGIVLSPFITKQFRTSRSGTGTKTITKKAPIRTIKNAIIPQATEEIPDQVPWGKALLAKFPTFDPEWSEEVKLKWFDAFDELLKRSKTPV
jgi:hypothetical protein